MKGAVAGGLILILVAASLGAGYLAGNSARQTETITSVSTLISTSTTTSQRTITSITTSAIPGGQPIPVASVQTASILLNGALAVAVNPDASRVYVLRASSLVVVDASSHAVIANVSLAGTNSGGIVNAGLAIDDSAGTVYASVDGKVVEVDGHTNSVAGELPFSLGTLAFDSAAGVLWGTQTQALSPAMNSNGSLVGVDVRTGSVVANVSVGFAPDGIAVDSQNHMVYSAGCSGSFVCGSEAALVNGTSGTLVTTVSLPSAYYSTMTLNPETDVLYVSGERMLAALNGTNGQEILEAGYADPETCGPFLYMAVDSSSNQVLMVPQNYNNYLLVYDGTSGALLNMYSLAGDFGPVAFDANTGEIFAATSAGLFAFHSSTVTGSVNSTLIGSYLNCLPV